MTDLNLRQLVDDLASTAVQRPRQSHDYLIVVFLTNKGDNTMGVVHLWKHRLFHERTDLK